MKGIKVLLLVVVLASLYACGGGGRNVEQWDDPANWWVNVNGDRVYLGMSTTVEDVEDFIGVQPRTMFIGANEGFLNAGLPVVVSTELGNSSVWVWSGDKSRQAGYNWPEIDRFHVSLRGSEVIPFEGWYVVSFSYNNRDITYPGLYSYVYNHIESAWGVVGTTTMEEIRELLGEPTREDEHTHTGGIASIRWTYGGGETWYRVRFEFNELGVMTGQGVNSFDFSDYAN